MKQLPKHYRPWVRRLWGASPNLVCGLYVFLWPFAVVFSSIEEGVRTLKRSNESIRKEFNALRGYKNEVTTSE